MPETTLTLAQLTFLAPMAGIIAASVAVPLLLALYFLKLRRRPVRVSSTLLWFTSTADLQVNTPFRWIRFSWLLLLQLVILALLIGAVARPATDWLPGDASMKTAVLIDCSASMGAMDGGDESGYSPMSRLAQAKAAARLVIDRLPPGGMCLVVSFGSRPELLTNLTRDRGMLRRAIDSIEVRDEPVNLDAALRLVAPLIGATGEENGPGPPRVVLLSDGAYGSAVEGLGGGTGLGRAHFEFVRVGPAPGAARPGDTGPDAPSTERDNLAVTALTARRDIDDPATVRLFIRVQNALRRPVDAGLLITLDGSPVGSLAITVPAADDESPGEASRTFSFENTQGGVAVVALNRPDLLESDNTAAVVLRAPESLRILLVRPDGAEDGVDRVLRDALEALGGRVRTMTRAEFERAPGAGSPTESDLVVLDRVRPTATPASPSISLGAGLPVPGLALFPDEEAGDRASGFIFWQRSHPVMRYVSPVGVWVVGALRMTLPDAEAAGVRAEELVTGERGPLIALIEERGVRRIVCAFDLGMSNWLREASFHVFLKNASDHLTLGGEDAAGRSHLTTEAFSVLPVSPEALLTVTGPLSFTRGPAPGRAGEGAPPARVPVGPLWKAGVYRIDGAVEADRFAAVNLFSPTESLIRTRDTLNLAGQRIEARSAGDPGAREVWHWFVLAALLLLGLEWSLFAWRMRV